LQQLFAKISKPRRAAEAPMQVTLSFGALPSAPLVANGDSPTKTSAIMVRQRGPSHQRYGDSLAKPSRLRLWLPTAALIPA